MPSADEVLSAFRLPSKVKLMRIGECFGLLEVIGHAMPSVRNNGRMFARSTCRCACGTERIYKNNGLRSGYWRSCGCKQVAHSARARTTHGHSVGGRRTSELNTHRQMLRRCYDPEAPHWNRYGGRGIIVCERWRGSFEAFLLDMGAKPSCSHSIDRIDNDGNYEPGNCRWSTPKEQRDNQRPSALSFEWNGETISRAEAARRLGISAQAVSNRFKQGWGIQRIMETPNAR